MSEETFSDERYFATRSPLDDKLIEKYCGRIEDRIRTAENCHKAKLMVDDACSRFEDQCGSEVISIFLKRHVNDLYEKYWGERDDHQKDIHRTPR